MSKTKNCIYVIENERGDEGFIYRIDLDENTIIDEVNGCTAIYNSEYGTHYNPISEEMYYNILTAHRQWENVETDEAFIMLSEQIYLALSASEALKLR